MSDSKPEGQRKKFLAVSKGGFLYDTLSGFSQGFFWTGLFFTFVGILVVTGTTPRDWRLFLAGIAIFVVSLILRFISVFLKKR